MKNHRLVVACFSILSLLLFFGNAAKADITNNLVLHLALDETTGTTAVDTGSSGRNGALSNFIDDDTKWTNGRIAGGLLFNPDFVGNDQVTVDGTGPLDFSTIDNPAFTLSAWVRGGLGVVQTNGAGVIAHGFGRGGEQYAIDLFANSFRFLLRDSNANAFTIQQTPGPTNVSDGSWQFVTGVYDGTLITNALKLYINGQLIGQLNGPTNATRRLLAASHDLTVGIREDSITSGYNLPFTGIIDEVRVYNRALSAADVLELYQSAGTVAPTIIVQPQGGTNFVGETASLSIVADGTFPMTYRWFKDSVLIAGATNSVLTLVNLQSTNAGTYFATASNSVNVATSSNAVLAVTTLATNDITTALIAWWKFNETSGTTAQDSTTNNNIATLNGFPTGGSQWQTNAPLGGALRFNVVGDDNGDKNDNVLTDAPISLRFSANFFSFAFWARADSLTDQGSNPRMITPAVDSGAVPTPWELWRRSGATGGGAGLGPNNPQTSAAIDLTWKHFVITHDIAAGAYNLYINGALVKSVATGYTRPLTQASTNRWAIGHQENLLPAGDADFFRGEFSDVRMYNRILTASQVAALYASKPTYMVIDIQPQTTTASERSPVTLLSVGDSSSLPVTYQWQKNGVPIPGATNSALTFTYVSTNDAGSYLAVIKNGVNQTAISSTAVLTVNPLPASDLVSDLVGYWPFDETTGSTATDLSSNLNNAVLNNFPDPASPWVPGVIGNALHFSTNTEYAETFSGISFGNTNDFSFAFWAKADSGTQGSNPRIISPATVHWVLWRPTATAGAGNPAGVGLYMPATSAQPLTNAWTHFVCVVNRPANLYTLYVNGVRTVVNATPTGQPAKPQPNPAVTWIMGHSETVGTQTDSFRGSLDEMRIYNRALNLNEVEALYEAGNVRPPLSVSRNGGSVTLSWPSWASDFAPQSADALSPSGTVWHDLNGTPTLNGANRTLTLTVGVDAKYFRLKK